MTCDDDLTIQYQEVAKTIANLLDKKIPPNKYAKCLASLKFRIRCLFDNSNNKAKHTNGRPFKGYKRRIAGKEGQVRCNLMGKRVEQAARSVIGPDPTLRVGEIAVPPKIADTLTCTEDVNRFNMDFLQDVVDSDMANHIVRGGSRRNLRYATTTKGTKVQIGDVVLRTTGEHEVAMDVYHPGTFVLQEGDRLLRGEEEIAVIIPRKRKFTLQIGDKVERRLMDNDLLLLNRQPTLHKASMAAQKMKRRRGNTIRMPLAITAPFNADFKPIGVKQEA